MPMIRQCFHFADSVWEAESDPATPIFLAGTAMYMVGSISGAIHPYGDEHLVGQMGGVWAHPLRVLHGWSFSLISGETVTPLAAPTRCDTYGSHIQRHYMVEGMQVAWTEFVLEEAPALIGVISVTNTTNLPWHGALQLYAELVMQGCWFGGWGVATPTSEAHGSLLVTTAHGAAYAGRASAIQIDKPTTWQINSATATATIELTLAPHEVGQIQIALAAAHHGGTNAATTLAQDACQRAAVYLAAKQQHYTRRLQETVLTTPDDLINRGWQLARLNLQLLAANYPDLPAYFLAGIPEYPQLFGCDNTYTTPGATAAGFAQHMRSTLAALATYAQRACARIPHEITTNGRIYHAGNAQETPQFAVACWDYLRWSGDIGFVRDIYPLLLEGMEHFRWSLEHNHYPVGDGMVERHGMGACKLDSTCYLYQALTALGQIAQALELPVDMARFSQQAEHLRERFERDWWLESEGMYADSMHLNGQPQFDGHWTVAVPIQVGIASPERARQSLARIEQEWVNQWGLVHTRGAEEHVWTLPTGILALAAFAHQRSDLGIHLLRNIAVTAQHGALGMLKELIPQGICFVQLWSAGLLIQGLVEGLLGIQPIAHQHRLTLTPHLPADWPAVTLRGLMLGAHSIDLQIMHERVHITHRNGPVPLTVSYAGHEFMVGVGMDSSIGA